MKLDSYEVRSRDDEVRMLEREGKPMIRGYAAVFNKRSQVITTPTGRSFVETIAPGAFRKALDGGADVRALANHQPNMILGRRGAGTLRLGEDETGLYYEIDPPDTSVGRDTIESLKRRDMVGSSFSFATIDDVWSKDETGLAVRELRSVHVFDVGPVTFPAYTEATAAYRSLDAQDAASPSPITVSFPTPSQIALSLRLRLIELS